MDLRTVSGLKDVGVAIPSYANILRKDNLGSWQFMVMPTRISKTYRSSYKSSGGIGSVRSQQFQYYEEELSIPSVSFSTKYYRKNLKTYVDDFLSLIKPIEAYSSPPVLAYVWGEEIFSPCIMTQASVAETDWFGDGILAACTMSITLLKVPLDQVVSV